MTARLDEIREMACVAFGVPLKTIEAATTWASLGADDQGVIEFFVEVEQRYGFTFNVHHRERARTVGDLATLVDEETARVSA
jgi:acyl carrier protein